MSTVDEGGNHQLNFDDIVSGLKEVPATDGNNINKGPVETPAPKETTAEDSKEQIQEGADDELDSIVDEVTGEVEAGDNQENEETEESSEEPADGQETFKYTYDGEEFEPVSYTHLTLPTICSV